MPNWFHLVTNLEKAMDATRGLPEFAVLHKRAEQLMRVSLIAAVVAMLLS